MHKEENHAYKLTTIITAALRTTSSKISLAPGTESEKAIKPCLPSLGKTDTFIYLKKKEKNEKRKKKTPTLILLIKGESLSPWHRDSTPNRSDALKQTASPAQLLRW